MPKNEEYLHLKEFVTLNHKTYYISTIEMNVRHTWQHEHANISVFETMVFTATGQEVDYHSSLYHRRYNTKEEALKGHQRTLDELERIIFTCKNCRNRLED